MVPGAPPRRRLLSDPAGAPEGRPDPKGQADAAAAPRGGPAHALGHRHRGPLAPRLPEASQNPLHVSLAFDDELSDQQKRDLERDWGEERDTTLHFHKFT